MCNAVVVGWLLGVTMPMCCFGVGVLGSVWHGHFIGRLNDDPAWAFE